MKTKNGLVTLQVPEGDLAQVFAALDARARDLKDSPNLLNEKIAIEIAHLRKQLYEQAVAQGWK